MTLSGVHKCLGRIAEDCAAIAYQQEVYGYGKHEQVAVCRGRTVSGHVLEVELTSARHVNVSRGLVCTGVQAEVEHEGALIFRGDDVRASVDERHVIAEERSVVLREDVDTMRLQLQVGDRLSVTGEGHVIASLLRRGSLGLACSGVPGDGIINDDRRVRVRGNINDVIRQESHVMPIPPLVGIGGRNVHYGPETDEHGLNGPLELRQEDFLRGNGDGGLLETVHANQRETNPLNVDVMNLGVHEDVVDVQLHVGDRLSSIDARPSREHGGIGDELFGVGHCKSSSGTLAGTSGQLSLGRETEEQISGGGEENVGLSFELNVDEPLSIRDGNGGNREPRVAVEPKDQGDPHVKSGLHLLGRLEAGEYINLATARGCSDDGRGGDGHTVHINESSDDRGVARGADDRDQVGVADVGDFLAHQALPSGLLSGGNAELLVENIRLGGVVVERVSVNLELNGLENPRAGVLAVPDEVARGRGHGQHGAGHVDVLHGVLGVYAAGGVLSSGNLRYGGHSLVGRADVGGERGNGSDGRARGGEGDVHQHIGEEITELGDAELDASAPLCVTGVCADSVVLVTESGERLEVGVHIQDVSPLNVNQRGGRIRESLLGTHTHYILNPGVQQFCGHDHAICLAVIGYELKHCTCSH